MALDNYEVQVWAVVGIHASLDRVKLLLARGMVVKGSGLLTATADRGGRAAVRLSLGMEESLGLGFGGGGGVWGV